MGGLALTLAYGSMHACIINRRNLIRHRQVRLKDWVYVYTIDSTTRKTTTIATFAETMTNMGDNRNLSERYQYLPNIYQNIRTIETDVILAQRVMLWRIIF